MATSTVRSRDASREMRRTLAMSHHFTFIGSS
jgi:hypothetical protein